MHYCSNRKVEGRKKRKNSSLVEESFLRSVGPEPSKKFLVFYVTRRFLYSDHKDPSLVAVLSQMIPLHAFSVLLFKFHFNIILPATIGLASVLFLLGFSTKSFTHFYSPMRATFAAHNTTFRALIILVKVKAYYYVKPVFSTLVLRPVS
jgi:hypothetical protein